MSSSSSNGSFSKPPRGGGFDEARLEKMLEGVFESDDAVIAAPDKMYAQPSRRMKRGVRRKLSITQTESIEVMASTPAEQVIEAPVESPFVESPSAKIRERRASKRVPVKFVTHDTSDHVVRFETPARLVQEVPLEAFDASIPDWKLPYHAPSSPDALIAHVRDLWVSDVDPRVRLEQFTPGDADTAFSQQYSAFSALTSPFIRWEPVEHAVTSAFTAPARINASQTTSADPKQAFEASFGFFPSIARTVRGWFGSVTQIERDVVEEIRETVQLVEDEVAEVEEDLREVWQAPVLVPRLQFTRVMAGFVGLLALVTLPAGAVSLSRSFGTTVSEARRSSEEALSRAQLALANTGSADQSWKQASAAFGRAQQSLSRANVLTAGISQLIPSTRRTYGSVQSLLKAGERFTQAGDMLSRGMQESLREGVGIHADERLETFLLYVGYAAPLLDDGLAQLETVDPNDLPEEARAKAAELLELAQGGREQLRDVQTLAQVFLGAVGHDRERTYLLVFQNNAELRPTGGFMGSVAEVRLDRGEVKGVTVPGGGPYDLRNQLRVRVAPPEPLRLVGGRWEFQDANWFPDFPASAEKIRWFWSEAGQPTVDGVITINATFLQRLLRELGPVELPEFGKTFTADNVLLELQKSVEIEYDREENQPKKIIGVLFEKLLERVKGESNDQWLMLLRIATESMETKDIQLWFANEDEQAAIANYGWSNAFQPTIGDALAVVEANIAGQKTDTVIDEEVEHRVEIAHTGAITDTVVLRRTHKAQKGELFQGVNNVSYVRVYVPKGSTLLEASGFDAPSSTYFEEPLPGDEDDADVTRLVHRKKSSVDGVDVTQEFDRTAFGGWIQLKPGETKETMFRYTLPFTAYDIAKRSGEAAVSGKQRPGYLLLATSQSGKLNRTIHTQVFTPANWDLTWSNQSTTATTLHLERVWDRDSVLAGIYSE